MKKRKPVDKAVPEVLKEHLQLQRFHLFLELGHSFGISRMTSWILNQRLLGLAETRSIKEPRIDCRFSALCLLFRVYSSLYEVMTRRSIVAINLCSADMQ